MTEYSGKDFLLRKQVGRKQNVYGNLKMKEVLGQQLHQQERLSSYGGGGLSPP